MNVPLLVTELSTLLIRSRALDMARGRRAPSLKPHSPPTARPVRNDAAFANVLWGIHVPLRYVVPVP